MNLALLFVLLAFATGRITRLVVADDLPPLRLTRNWIVGLRPDVMAKQPTGRNATRVPENAPYRNHWWLGELITCAWCASGWVSLGLWLGTWWFVPLPWPVLWWPAIWGGGAWLSAKLWK